MPLQGLEDQTKRDLLQKVKDGQYDLDEMRDASTRVKKKILIQKKIMKLLDATNWDEVERKYKELVAEDKVNQFTHLKIEDKDNLPLPKVRFNYQYS